MVVRVGQWLSSIPGSESAIVLQTLRGILRNAWLKHKHNFVRPGTQAYSDITMVTHVLCCAKEIKQGLAFCF